APRRPTTRTASSVAGMVADRRPALAGCGTICPVPTTGRPISLAHLTVLDATPPELVTVAADAGFRSIGIRLTATPRVGVREFAIDTGVRTLAHAADVVARSKRSNASVLIDALHWSRSGGIPAHVKEVDPSLLRYVQICDAGPDMPGPTDTPALIREARTGRL